MTESQKPRSSILRRFFPRRFFSRRFLSRRFLVLSLLVAGTAFTIGTVLSQTIPKVKSWLLVSIDEFSRENLPLRILASTVDFRFVPLGITLNDVRILPTEEFEKENGKLFSALTIQEVRADLSMLQIIRGEVELPDGLFCASASRGAKETLRAISTELCQGCVQCIAVNILR